MAASVEDQVKDGEQNESQSSHTDEGISSASDINAEIENSIFTSPDPEPGVSAASDNVDNETKSPVKEKCTVPDDKTDSIYHIKWISLNGRKSPIVTQNENGPCPLIAIINVLIMKGRITLPSLVDFVTTENLMEYLGDCILDSI
ncbi:Protein FAM63A, partial [Stegodyphus mimosarum]